MLYLKNIKIKKTRDDRRVTYSSIWVRTDYRV
jgi:hypothetical protein